MAIKDEINKIQTEKNYLRAAIQEKGVFVNDEPFALYPVRISEITDTPGECDDELRTLIEKKMTSYTVPSYVDTIGSFVFYNCVNLESISIPDSVTYIGHSSFMGCTSLTSIDIPSSVTSIGNQAFRNCTSLTNVTIGSGVTEIQMYAFYGCSSLASITVNAETPPTLGTRAFDNTNDCPIYVQEDSVEAYKSAWSQYADRIQAIPVPSFTKITSLDEATSGKYLIVNTSANKALNASLIKDTTTSTNGINTANNMIDVTIENDIIVQDDNTLNAVVDYDADNKTLSWTDSDAGTTYYLYWNGSGAKFAYSGNMQPSTQYPMEAKYYENFGSFSFANSTRLVGYNNEKSRFNFYLPNIVYKYESNMALFKLN